MTVTLRPYQQASVDALWDYFAKYSGNPLVVVPTGGGKSWIQAAFIKSVLERFPNERFLLLTHVKELIQQNAEKLEQLLPWGTVGVYSAGLRRRELDRAVTVAGVQSIHKRAPELGRVSLVMIDECHRVPTKGEGMYRNLLADLQVMNPHVKIIGLSATPYRLGTGWLHRGKGRLFTDIAYQVPVLDLIRDGYLSPLRSKSGVAAADLSGVHVRGGEFVARELEQVMDDEDLVSAALDEVETFCADRKKWILFCSGVQHATHVRDELRERGIPSECVTGETPAAERDEIIRRFKAGEFRALTNVSVLTTGFDAPDIDAVIMMRPTQSASLYQQMVGRGLRLAPGKADCLVLDFAGNIQRHGPIDRVDVRSPDERHGEGGGPPPTKTCETCREEVLISTSVCPACSTAFPLGDGPGIQTEASSLPILSSDDPDEGIERLTVTHVDYAIHEKPGKPDSLRVTYFCGLTSFREWVLLEHHGYARTKAERWWRTMAQSSEVPDTIDAFADASEGLLLKPREIVVDTRGRYPRILQLIGLHHDAESEAAE